MHTYQHTYKRRRAVSKLVIMTCHLSQHSKRQPLFPHLKTRHCETCSLGEKTGNTTFFSENIFSALSVSLTTLQHCIMAEVAGAQHLTLHCMMAAVFNLHKAFLNTPSLNFVTTFSLCPLTFSFGTCPSTLIRSLFSSLDPLP